MKAVSFLILLTVFFVSDYALAAPCPCDTAELSNGLTGNDIVALLCPGGTIGEGNVWSVNPGVVAINGDVGNGSDAAYDVFTDLMSCRLTDFVNPAVFVSLTDQQVEACRARLIAGCRLLINPIPTLSEWGMIAMAGVLGVIGFIVAARRRKALA